jgi:outer membrane receptor for ferrienterochelin and colicins
MGIKVLAAALMVFGLSAKALSQKLMGLVVQKNEKGLEEPLQGANVFWLNSASATTTRSNGIFLIDRAQDAEKLVISFVGFVTDTVTVGRQANLKIILIPGRSLNEVTVEGWRPSVRSDPRSTINSLTMNEKELFKAACCNLSESFETNPAVDVAFTDAITGTKQIQMLGLSGPNTMVSVENIPGVRGLASVQGIQFIPGPWINSIQLTKGTGSVVNGYESIAGQINVELKKPQESDKVYVNGYMNSSGRTEANLIYTKQTSKKWGTTFLVHGNIRPLEMDQNKDSFLDFPKGQQVNFINRWIFNSGTGWLGQFSAKFLTDKKIGGQTGYVEDRDKFTTNRYGLGINTNRYEIMGKMGYVFPDKPYKSFGMQIDGVSHQQDSYFGFNIYDGQEQSVYANGIYQSIIGSTRSKFKTGLSFLFDKYQEALNRAISSPSFAKMNFNRTEIVPGAFFEYTYDNLSWFSVVAGARVDQHNLFGTFFVPRLHMKFDITPETILRVSGGKGIRVANILAENSGFLASARSVVLSQLQSTKAYGFRPDKAWNFGGNLNHTFSLWNRTGVINIDYFYTTFQNQAVVDWDRNPQQINFFGLTGKSFSTAGQAQVDYQVITRFDLRMAYRWVDVKTDYLDGRRMRPLVPRDRAFMNLAYATRNHWKADFTIQRIGSQRLPVTSSNPIPYQLQSNSPSYFLLNTQVTRDAGKLWSFYVGIENIGNFKLKNPIVSASDPFGPYFDSSMVWGPVFGRMWYAGFRYRVK